MENTSKKLSRLRSDLCGAVYLHAMVWDQPCDCVLDTGSDVTFIPASVAEDVTVTKTNHRLAAANGTEIKLLGEASLPITFGKYKGVITGSVSEHVAEVMLGIDWLVDNGIIWEFKESGIKVGGVYYTLQRHSSANSWCRRVVLQDTAVAPSRSGVDLQTKVVLRIFFCEYSGCR